jgi:serine/threonine protein kinase/tetratricopeptide (TPR) repeat protein
MLRPGMEPVQGYRLVKRLGAGGCGEVWQAEAQGGFPVALKFVRLADKAEAAEVRALQIIKEVRHPNLLVTFGAWEIDGFLVVGMELADKTLLDRLKECVGAGQPGIPRDELLEYMQEAAKGIDHLNRHCPQLAGRQGMGVQHRDIKPQNILLVGGGVKVADFGLAKVLEQAISSNSGSMTPAYAAPEFFQGKTTTCSDQYSLAVTYCHLRGNRLPFSGHAAAMMAGHLLEEPDLNMLPEEERPVVGRALAKDAGKRWPSCRDFVNALCRCAGAGAPAPMGPPPGTHEMRALQTLKTPKPEALLDDSPPTKVGAAASYEADTPTSHTPAALDVSLPLGTKGPRGPRSDPALTVAPASEMGEAPEPPRWDQPDHPAPSRGLLLPAVVVVLLVVAVGAGLWALGIFPPRPSPTSSAVADGTKDGAAGKDQPKAEGTFALRSLPPVTLKAGDKQKLQLGIDRHDFRDSIEVMVSGPPADQVTITPGSFTLPADKDTAEVEVAAARNAGGLDTELKIVAEAGGVTKKATVPLTVEKASGGLQLQPPAPVQVRAGGKATAAVQLKRNGVEGPVGMTTTGKVPAGVSIKWSPVGPGQNVANAEVTAEKDAPPGEYRVGLLANAGGVEVPGGLRLVIGKAAAIRLEVPKTLFVEAGDTALLKFRVAREGVEGEAVVRLSTSTDDLKLKDVTITVPAGENEGGTEVAASEKAKEGKATVQLLAKAGAFEDSATLEVTVRPDSYQSFLKEAGDLYDKKEYDAAIEAYGKAVQHNPKRPRAYYERGLTYRYQGKTDEAIADYTRAIERDEKFVPGYLSRALAYLTKRPATGMDYDLAIADCNKVLEIEPGNWAAFNRRGLAYAGKKDYPRAIEDYNRAINLKRDVAEFYYNRAVAHHALGDQQRDKPDRGRKEYLNAVEDYNEAINLKKDPAYYERRANVNDVLGERQKAQADREEAKRLRMARPPADSK